MVDPCKGYTTLNILNDYILGGEPLMINGEAVYTLEWEYLKTATDTSVLVKFNGYTIGQAYPVQYQLFIKDKNDCVNRSTEPIIIEVVGVQYPPYEISGSLIDQSGNQVKQVFHDCIVHDQDVGNIGINVSGGVPPFEINWMYRSSTQRPFIALSEYKNQYFLANLARGEYKVQINSSQSSCLPSDGNYSTYHFEEIIPFYVSIPSVTSSPVYHSELCDDGLGTFEIEIANLPEDATFHINSERLEVVSQNDNGRYVLQLSSKLEKGILQVRDGDNCLLISVPLDVELATPKFSFSSVSSELAHSIPKRELINFTNESEGNYSRVRWVFGDGQSSEIISRTELESQHYSHQYLLEGNYRVILELYNKAGCFSTSSQTITTGEGYHVLTPNAFTPNRDQINDVFRPILSGFSQVMFTIYDQNGNLLYKENKMDTDPPRGIIMDGWDGNNAPQSARNFIYTIEGLLFDQVTKIERVGTFIALK